VLVVPVGSVVDFPNHDPFFHNVFSLFDGKRFDLGLYEAGATNSVRFDRLGVSFLFCNIHPEMSAVGGGRWILLITGYLTEREVSPSKMYLTEDMNFTSGTNEAFLRI